MTKIFRDLGGAKTTGIIFFELFIENRFFMYHVKL